MNLHKQTQRQTWVSAFRTAIANSFISHPLLPVKEADTSFSFFPVDRRDHGISSWDKESLSVSRRNFLQDKEREVGEEIHLCSLGLSALVILRAQCLKLQRPPFDHKVTSPIMKINPFILEEEGWEALGFWMASANPQTNSGLSLEQIINSLNLWLKPLLVVFLLFVA